MATQRTSDIPAYLLNAIENLGNWLGLGPVIEGMTASFTEGAGGHKLTPSGVNKLIDELVKTAREKGNNVVQDLNNRLNSIMSTLPKSNNYRDALNRGLAKTQDAIKQATNLSQQAEEKLASARQNAANIEMLSDTQRMSWGGKGRQLAEDALSDASDALSKFKELEKLK